MSADTPMTRTDVAATWLWAGEFAASGLTAAEFVAELNPRRRALVAQFLVALDAAQPDAPDGAA